MEQSPLCYAALEYIHSLIEAREEKRGKKCEKEGLENWDPPLTIQPHAEWIASRMSLKGCCSGHASCQGARLEVHYDVHDSIHNRVDTDQPDYGKQSR